MVGVGPGALGDLEDHRGLLLAAGLGDALDDLHVVDVEGADGVTAVIGLLEHFGRSNKGHGNNLLIIKSLLFYHIFPRLQHPSGKKLPPDRQEFCGICEEIQCQFSVISSTFTGKFEYVNKQ